MSYSNDLGFGEYDSLDFSLYSFFSFIQASIALFFQKKLLNLAH